MTPEQLAALKIELQSDKLGIGYANRSHEDIARLINSTTRQIADDNDRPTWQLYRCFDPSELATAESDAAKFRRLQLLCSLPSINPSAARLRQSIVFVFGNPSQTLDRFDTWAKRTGTRSEELGFGRVTESDIADALRS